MRKSCFLIILLVVGLIYLRADALLNWSAVNRMTTTSGMSSSPAIAVDSSNTIHVIWVDETPGPPDIYYKKGK